MLYSYLHFKEIGFFFFGGGGGGSSMEIGSAITKGMSFLSATDFQLLHHYRPAKLIEIVKKRFISLGGVIFEGYSVSSICIYEDAAVSFLTVQSDLFK